MTIYKSIFLILSFNSLVFSKVSIKPKKYELEQLLVLFRHGDRAPTVEEIYEGDPYNKIYQSIGYGQLTKIGKRREYKIGEFLRERYNSFLEEYENDVYAYSSDEDRTKMSLQLVLAGLYPPGPSTSWSNSLDWQPIPTNYEAKDISFLTAPFSCSKFIELFNEVANTPEMLTVFNEHRDLFEKIERKTGITITKLFTAGKVYGNLHSALSLGLPLPAWCTRKDFRELEKIISLVYKAFTYTEQLRRISVGPIVEQFLTVLKEKDTTKKIHLYSGHGHNVGPFIDAHNITGAPNFPDFGSTLVLEKLRGSDDRYYLRVYLWTGVTERFIQLKISNCKRTCPLSDYEKIVQTIVPNQEPRICTPETHCRRQADAAN